MKRKKSEAGDGAAFDMTPMIDCVFQLIIFFIVCTQVTTQENVSLRLPDALAANKEPADAQKLFTVHIASLNQNPSAVEQTPQDFGWFCYGDPQPRTVDEMKGILQKEAHFADPNNPDRPGYDQANNRSENLIVVRVDARAPAGEFGKLIEMMARDARIYKIKVAVLQDIKVD